MQNSQLMRFDDLVGLASARSDSSVKLSVNCWDLSKETISSEASTEERSTTIPYGSTSKWMEIQIA